MQSFTEESQSYTEETMKQWYVIYTKSRAEKQVNQRLLEQGIETYLPLQKIIRQWADRKKRVEVPTGAYPQRLT